MELRQEVHVCVCVRAASGVPSAGLFHVGGGSPATAQLSFRKSSAEPAVLERLSAPCVGRVLLPWVLLGSVSGASLVAGGAPSSSSQSSAATSRRATLWPRVFHSIRTRFPSRILTPLFHLRLQVRRRREGGRRIVFRSVHSGTEQLIKRHETQRICVCHEVGRFLRSNVLTSTRHRICRCCHGMPQSGKMACLMNLGLKHILGKLVVLLIVDETGRSNRLPVAFETCPSQTKNPKIHSQRTRAGGVVGECQEVRCFKCWFWYLHVDSSWSPTCASSSGYGIPATLRSSRMQTSSEEHSCSFQLQKDVQSEVCCDVAHCTECCFRWPPPSITVCVSLRSTQARPSLSTKVRRQSRGGV